ncbi:MAG: transposase family protein [Blastocatellia bacterium]
MSLYQKIARKPKQFLTLTGMELSEFERLLPTLQTAHDQQEETRKALTVRTQQARQRQPGGGAQYGNDLAARCLMLLLYYRLYVTPDFLSLLFHAADKSVICRGIQSVRAAWLTVLPLPAHVRERILTAAQEVSKQRQRRIGSVEEFRDAYPELEFLIDGTEQPKRKPGNQPQRQDDYSGKKKRHTRKQLVTTTRSGLIIDQSPSVGGKAHDFKVFKEDHAQRGIFKECVGLRVTLYADSGFQGLQDQVLPVECRVVKRATRNHPLTREERAINRYRASQRMANEHIIGRRKKYQIAAQEYRNRDADYDTTMEIVAGLVNLRALKRISQRTGVTF